MNGWGIGCLGGIRIRGYEEMKGMKGEDELMVGVWLSAWALGHGW